MSGHSKWATTKHKKAVVDAKRGKLFAKLIKNIEVAARTGGGDIGGNPTLADAIAKAKSQSVPNDNIDRAHKRGAGLEAGGADWETITYEGYGPQRRRDPGRVPDRQPQPGRVRGPHRDEPQRRLARRPRLGGLPVQPQGRRAGAQGRADRGRRAGRGPRRRRRRGQRPRRHLRGSQRGDGHAEPSATPSPTPGSRSRAPTSPGCPASRCRWRTKRRPARSCGSSTPSRTATTSRTSGPTSTSATRSSKRSAERLPAPPEQAQGVPPETGWPACTSAPARPSVRDHRRRCCTQAQPWRLPQLRCSIGAQA